MIGFIPAEQRGAYITKALLFVKKQFFSASTFCGKYLYFTMG